MAFLKNKSKIAVHTDNLSVYYDKNSALTNISLDIVEGEYVGIIGPNGGGKSTFLKAVTGLIPTSSGNVEIYGNNIKKRKTVIGYVPQFSTLDKSFPITLLEVVMAGCLKRGKSLFYKYTKEDKKNAMELIKKVGMENLQNRRISELSGGEFQRMLIARALAVNPSILFLDEPTASVDIASRNQIYTLLSELNKSMTIILVTHDLLAISSEVSRLICINKKLIYNGKPEITEKIVNNLYGCPLNIIKQL